MPARRYRAPMPELFTIARPRRPIAAPVDVTPFVVTDLRDGVTYLVVTPELDIFGSES